MGAHGLGQPEPDSDSGPPQPDFGGDWAVGFSTRDGFRFLLLGPFNRWSGLGFSYREQKE